LFSCSAKTCAAWLTVTVAFGFDDRLLRLDGGLLALDGRQRGQNIGFRLVQGDPVVAIVDPGQDLAGLHGLVVADENLAEVTRHLRGYGDAVGLDIGVVRRDVESADRPVVPSVVGSACECGEARADQEQPAEPALGFL
jgi:hypothetical protein